MIKLVNTIIDAYIEVMGAEKWNSLTADEQHTVIMTIVKDLNERF
mgnify:CR=1 FL=1